MEDERCFSTLAFIKSKHLNKVTTYLPQMLCACLDNDSIHCKISWMKNALSNGAQHDIDIVMMVKSFVGFLHLFKCINLIAYVSNFIEINGCFTR
jgi:hypothetical protein